MPSPPDIARRKEDHLRLALDQRAAPPLASGGFDRWVFTHCALPELDYAAIDLSTRFLGKELRAPLLISSMTGGPERAALINANLASAAEALGIALAVGSQRVALEAGGAAGLGAELRRLAPTVPLFANLGAAQLNLGYGLDETRRAVEMIGADGLILHLNPLQEAVQPEGDRDWSGLLARIEAVARALPVPVIAKEVGCGISGPVARRLVDAGVAAIDVAGAGGTSWAAIEAERASDPRRRAVGRAFADWGIATAEAIAGVRLACPETPLIGSGGIRSGIDAAKSIRLGADLVGQAAGLLEAALRSAEDVADVLQTTIDQLRIVCFCTGSPTLTDLRSAEMERAEPR